LAGGNGGVNHGDGAQAFVQEAREASQAKPMQEQNLLLVSLVFLESVSVDFFFGLFYE